MSEYHDYCVGNRGNESSIGWKPNLIEIWFTRNVSPVLKWLDSGDTAENFFEGQISTARETEQKISLEVKSQRD